MYRIGNRGRDDGESEIISGPEMCGVAPPEVSSWGLFLCIRFYQVAVGFLYSDQPIMPTRSAARVVISRQSMQAGRTRVPCPASSEEHDLSRVPGSGFTLQQSAAQEGRSTTLQVLHDRRNCGACARAIRSIVQRLSHDARWLSADPQVWRGTAHRLSSTRLSRAYSNKVSALTAA